MSVDSIPPVIWEAVRAWIRNPTLVIATVSLIVSIMLPITISLLIPRFLDQDLR
jgi:hypothetical protein